MIVQEREARVERLRRLGSDLSPERLVIGTRDNLLGVVAERALGLALLIVLPLVLAPNALGVYYEVTAVVALLQVVAVLGMDVGLVRYTALASARSDLRAVRASFRICLALTGVLSVTLAAVVWLVAPALGRVYEAGEFTRAARLAAPALPLVVTTLVLLAPSKGFKLMYPSVIAIQVTQPAVQLALTIALLAAGVGLEGALVAFTVSAVFSWLVAGWLLHRLHLPPAAATFRTAVARDLRPLLRFSIPVSGMMLAGTALLWVDTLLLGSMRSAAEVATYGVVVRLMTAAAAASLTVSQVFGPYVTQLVEARDRERLRRYLVVCTRLTILVAAPLLVSLVVVGGPVLKLLHQDAGVGERAVLILCVAFLVQMATGPLGQVLTMSGRSLLNFGDNAVAVAANVGMNLLLIPRFGAVGAAVAWSVAIVGLNAVRMVQVWRILRISPLSRSLLRPVVALGCALVATLVSRPVVLGALPAAAGVLVLAACFGAIYAGCLAILGLYPEDRMLIRAILRPGRSRAILEGVAP